MGVALAIGFFVLEVIGWLFELVWWVGYVLEPIASAVVGAGGRDPARDPTIRRLAGPGHMGRRRAPTDAAAGREPPDDNTRPMR